MDAMNRFEDDALDRELQAALRVDPSPEFVARVRLRVAEVPSAHTPRPVLAFGVTALAIVAIAAIVVPRLQKAPTGSGVPVDSTANSEKAIPAASLAGSPPTVVPYSAAWTTGVPRQGARASHEPSIVVSRTDAEALEEYIQSIYAPPIQWKTFSVHRPWPDDWLVPLPEIPRIAVTPLVIEPLNPVAQ